MADETRPYGSEPPLEASVGAALEATVAAVRPSQPMPVGLAPGTTVGEYRVLRKLGEGGMGAVYAGEQPTIGKRVAIKVLAPHCASNPDLVRRFVEEARAANRIHHPPIIDIFSFSQLPDGRHGFVMGLGKEQVLAVYLRVAFAIAAEGRGRGYRRKN